MRSNLRAICFGAIAIALVTTATATRVQGAGQPALNSARITVNGTSNVHAWTASTATVRLARIVAGESEGDPLEALLQPAGLKAFEIAIPATSLKSPKDGLDKNMHKALKADKHAEITFALARLEAKGSDVYRATGVLRIAGVEKEVAFELTATRRDSTIAIKGETPLVMTDYGITPPKAMLGMLTTDPKVTIQFEALLGL